jgi:MFS family permease
MDSQKSSLTSPFAVSNIRLFIAFRIFFNARFYYPVFTILFIDFGLTLSQFALMNAVWAATIVIMEVPSGALADIWGRRNLLIFASALMIIEMLLLCFVPRGYSSLLFTVFLINRVLSGTAEAAASGADEALAYDALKSVGNESQWRRVLAMQMRLRSIAAIIATTIGAAVYDPVFMQRVISWIGLDIRLTIGHTIRFPIYLTLCMAFITLFVTLRMRELNVTTDDDCGPMEQCGKSVKEIFSQTLQAGRWILATPWALVVIAAGFLFDGIIRMVITLTSQYYRLIEIPEATFGLIGSLLAGLGLILPRIAVKMTDRFTPRMNLLSIATTTIIGLVGMSFFKPIIGLVPAIILFSGMYLNGFFISHYLNQITPSSHRATVLSFKGLSFNLFYGILGVLYSVLLAWMKPRTAVDHPGIDAQKLEGLVFIDSFQWFPWAFVIGLIVFIFFGAYKLRSSTMHKQVMQDS